MASPAAAEPAAHLEAVQAGHGHVEDDGVGRALGVGDEGGGAVLGQLGLVALEAQGAVERLADRRFVVDHKHPHTTSVANAAEECAEPSADRSRRGTVPPMALDVSPAPAGSTCVETILGHEVADPYRWLEDPDDAGDRGLVGGRGRAVPTWSARPAPGSGPAAVAACATCSPASSGRPLVVGGRRFFMRRQPGAGSRRRCRGRRHGDERLLIDPSALSADHTVTLDGWAVSIEGDRLAYLLSEGGDEESALRVMDVATGAVIDGPIDRIRYSPIAWLPGGDVALLRAPPGPRPGAGGGGAVPPAGLAATGSAPIRPTTSWSSARAPTETAYLGRRPLARRALAERDRQPRHRPSQRLLPGRPPARATRSRRSGGSVLEGVDAQAWPHVRARRADVRAHRPGRPRRKLVRLDPARPDPSGWTELLAEDPDGGGPRGRRAGRGRHRRRPEPPRPAARCRSTTAATGAFRPRCALPGPGSAGRDRPARRGPRGLDRLHRPRHARTGSCTSTSPRSASVDAVGRTRPAGSVVRRPAGDRPPARWSTGRRTAPRCGCS